jgi:cation-dependent mannose-6-phosphate receptor
MMRFLPPFFALLLSSPTLASFLLDTTPDPPCTATSPLTGSFVDLRSLSRIHYVGGSPDGPEAAPKLPSPDPDWTARGWDYPANFTINVCAPVAPEEGRRFVGLDEPEAHPTPGEGRDGGGDGLKEQQRRRRRRRSSEDSEDGEKEGDGDVQPLDPQKNVAAFYTINGTAYSLGIPSDRPVFRGRKLVLTYTDGSPCPHQPASRGLDTAIYRKSTIMSFMCDQSLMVKAAVAFVGTTDECSYFFEVRTGAACPGVKTEGGVGVGWLFGGM